MLTKYASFAVLAVESASGEVLREAEQITRKSPFIKQAHRHDFDYERRPGYIYVRSRAISSRTNDNYDQFPASEIKAAYRTFIGKPVFVNHHNSDHRRMRGVIIDAALHEDLNPDGTPDTWAEVLMEVDAVRFPRLAEAVVNGDIARTSMGTDVKYSICTACGNKAETPADYCQHIPRMKGMKIRRFNAAAGRQEEVLIAEVCYGLGFFENSLLVEDPADPTAYAYGVETGPGLEHLRVAASRGASQLFNQILHEGGGHTTTRQARADDRIGSVSELQTGAKIFYRNNRIGAGSFIDAEVVQCRNGIVKIKGGKQTGFTRIISDDDLDDVNGVSLRRRYASLTKKADDDQCPSCSGDGLSVGGGVYACQDCDALFMEGDDKAIPGITQSKEAGIFTDLLDLMQGGRDPRNQCMECGSNFRWSEAMHKFVCPQGHTGVPAMSSKRTAFGEPKAPSKVDTLRSDRCPVCKDDESFNGDKCSVCGHVEPPPNFRDPDLEKAQQVDLRQEDADPMGDDGAVGDPEDPLGLEGEDEGDSSDLECNNCGEVFSAEEDETEQGSDEGEEDQAPEGLQGDDSEDPDAPPFDEHDDLSDLADKDDSELGLNEEAEDDEAETEEEPEQDPEEETGDSEDLEISVNMTCPICGQGTLVPAVGEAPAEPDSISEQVGDETILKENQ